MTRKTSEREPTSTGIVVLYALSATTLIAVWVGLSLSMASWDLGMGGGRLGAAR